MPSGGYKYLKGKVKSELFENFCFGTLKLNSIHISQRFTIPVPSPYPNPRLPMPLMELQYCTSFLFTSQGSSNQNNGDISRTMQSSLGECQPQEALTPSLLQTSKGRELPAQNRQGQTEEVPSASALIIKALKEWPRDRKKQNIKHSGHTIFDEIVNIAQQMWHLFLAQELSGTIKEIPGTAQSVDCSVDGCHPHDIMDDINSGAIHPGALGPLSFEKADLPGPQPKPLMHSEFPGKPDSGYDDVKRDADATVTDTAPAGAASLILSSSPRPALGFFSDKCIS
eukprot:bmy_18783T0